MVKGKISLIGGEKNYCCFVAKQDVTYAASKVTTYHIPPFTKARDLARKELEEGTTILSKEQLENLMFKLMLMFMMAQDSQAPNIYVLS